MLNPAKIKNDFPIFRRKIEGKEIIYLDNAATTQKPKSVIDAIKDYYENFNSNVHRGIYKLSEEATDMYEKARRNVSDFIGGTDPNGLVFVRNATEALNLLASSIGQSLKRDDEVLITLMEHHSNIVPWQFLMGKGVKIKYADLKDDGTLNMEDFASKLTQHTKVVSVTHVSNVLGTINDAKELARIAHEKGATFILDGAQSVPHMPVDVKDIDCDYVAFSGHKMLGPMGIGGLYGKPDLLSKLPPYMGGGEMINTVTTEGSTWADIPLKFEAGTPNVADAIGLSAAVDYLKNIGMKEVRKHESEMILYAFQEEKYMENLKSFGPRSLHLRGGVYSFNIGDIPSFNIQRELEANSIRISRASMHPHDVASEIDKEGIAIRSGHHCAMPLMARLDVQATARASFYIYNSKEEIDKLFIGLQNATARFGH